MAAQHIEHSGLQAGIQRRSGIDLLVLFDGRPTATHRNPPVDPLGLRQLPGKFRHWSVDSTSGM